MIKTTIIPFVFVFFIARLCAQSELDNIFLSPDGTETVSYANKSLEKDWQEAEIQRYLQRPDFIVVTDKVEGEAPPKSWAYPLLKAHGGKKKLVWVTEVIFKIDESTTVRFPNIIWYFLCPIDTKDADKKAWKDSNLWQDLLIKPPIGKWIEVQDRPTKSYAGPWGGGAYRGWRINGQLYGSAGTEFQREKTFGGYVTTRVVVEKHEKPFTDDNIADKSYNSQSFSWKQKVEIKKANNHMGVIWTFDQQKYEGADDYSNYCFWRSGDKTIHLSGDDLGPGNDVVEAYLKKFPSDVPLTISLDPEAWVMRHVKATITELAATVNSPDSHLGSTDGLDTWEIRYDRLECMNPAKIWRKEIVKEKQSLNSTLLYDNRRFDWIAYQTALRNLRTEHVNRLTQMYAQMEQRGIELKDKGYEVKSK